MLVIAAKLFRQSGYAGATTRDLARELGIQSASLYYHIGSKEDLLHELSVDALTRMGKEAESAMAQETTPLDRLHALVTAHVVTALADQDKHAVMLQELRALGKKRRKAVMELRDRYEHVVREAIAAAQEEGTMRRDLRTKDLALALLNLLNWPIFWYHPRGELSPEALAEMLWKVFSQGACHDIEQTSQARMPRRVPA